MAEVIPFKGIRYNQQKIDSLESVVTPPYDVINQQAQEQFYQSDPYNIIRLELNKTYPTDTEANNRYTRAAEVFQEWLQENILTQETAPSVYLYQQKFTAAGENYTRTGFMAALKCVDYAVGAVLPHEETLPKAKIDRKLLLESCQANFSSIFGLYDEPEKATQQLLVDRCAQIEPQCSVTDNLGVIHQLWVIDDAEIIKQVQTNLLDKTVYIADGHHRYETAVKHAKDMSAQGKTGYDKVLVTLVNLHDEGLIILPTHRMLRNLVDFDLDWLLSQCGKYFSVEAVDVDSFQQRLETSLRTAFVIYAGQQGAFLLTLKENIDPATLHGADKSLYWRNLDVSILHSLILENILGVGSSQRASGDYIAYTREAAEAFEKVDNNQFQLSVLMNATKVDEVTNVATAGDKMPQKSTYFYPKLITGLVINPLG